MWLYRFEASSLGWKGARNLRRRRGERKQLLFIAAWGDLTRATRWSKTSSARADKTRQQEIAEWRFFTGFCRSGRSLICLEFMLVCHRELFTKFGWRWRGYQRLFHAVEAQFKLFGLIRLRDCIRFCLWFSGQEWRQRRHKFARLGQVYQFTIRERVSCYGNLRLRSLEPFSRVRHFQETRWTFVPFDSILLDLPCLVLGKYWLGENSMLLPFSDVRCDNKAIWDRDNGLLCWYGVLRGVFLLSNGLAMLCILLGLCWESDTGCYSRQKTAISIFQHNWMVSAVWGSDH